MEVAKKHFQSLELNKALEVINQSIKNRHKEQETDISFPGNMLWYEILLAQGRFSNDKTFSAFALSKLLEGKSLLPPLVDSINFIPFYLLLAEAYMQLNKVAKAKKILNNLLKISKKEDYLIGEIQVSNRLGELAFKEKNIHAALAFANQSLELLIQNAKEEYALPFAETYALLTIIYKEKSDFSQAKNYGERLLSISEIRDLRELEIKAHLLLGEIAIGQQVQVDAITHLLQAKEKSEFAQHEYFLARAILQIGIVYNQVFDYPKALENHQLVAKKYYDLLETTDQVLLTNYLGKSHFLSFQNELAEKYFDEAIVLSNAHNNRVALAFSFAYLGEIFARKKNFEKALIYAKRANNIIEQFGDIDGAQVNLINLGGIHCQLDKYSEGIKLASRGIAAAKRMKDGFYEIRGYQIMAEIFRKKKEYKSAVMYQMIYTKFYEDFYQRNDRQKVSEIAHQFAIQKLEKKIERLKGGVGTRC